MRKILFLIFTSFLSFKIFAFPEMIRHGYTNCTACHVSPSGGGVMTAYGKSLSKEVLSTWGAKNEENFLHGLIDTEAVNDWLVLGGDIRAVQVHQENDLVRRGKFIKMQAGVELGINRPDWAVVAFVGEYDRQQLEWLSNAPRYYALYRATDELTLRAGRFIPQFGINNSDHIFSTRSPLGLGYGTEKDTAEIAWLGENWNFVGSYYKTPDLKSSLNESGFAGVISRILSNKNKISIQYLSEKNDLAKRTITGISGLFGWTENLYSMIEYDRQSTEITNSPATKVDGHYFNHKTGYEFFKGFHGLILNDYLQADVDTGATKNYKFGPGVQWFPRPHFDFQLFWTRQQSSQNVVSDGDYAWFVMHYYL